MRRSIATADYLPSDTVHPVKTQGSPASLGKTRHVPRRLMRDPIIDVLRGIALLALVALFMRPFLNGSAPIGLRIFISVAEPWIILIAGLMIGRAHTLNLEGRGWDYYLKRFLFLLAIASFLDMAAWRMLPLQGMSLLYFLSLSMPLAFLASKMSDRTLGILALLCMAAGYPMHVMGITDFPIRWLPVGLTQAVSMTSPTIVPLQAWHSGGWFPVIPFAGMLLLGIMLARQCWRKATRKSFASAFFYRCGLSMFFTGMILSVITMETGNPQAMSATLFAPTAGLLLMLSGAAVLMLSFIEYTRRFALWGILRCLGEAPMLIYILSAIIIGRVLPPIFGKMDTGEFYLVYGWLVLWLVCISWTARMAGRGINRSGRGVRWLIGGQEI